MSAVSIADAADTTVAPQGRPQRLSPIAVYIDDNGKLNWGFPGSEPAEIRATLRAMFGSTSDAFVRGQIDGLVHALAEGFGRPPAPIQMDAALAFIQGVAPRDELEAALAVQMAITHAVSLHLTGRLMRTDPLRHDFESNGIIAAKFLRAFSGQVEALVRLRRPAVQVVRVERLNVSDGGNAIVGAVQTTRST